MTRPNRRLTVDEALRDVCRQNEARKRYLTKRSTPHTAEDEERRLDTAVEDAVTLESDS